MSPQRSETLSAGLHFTRKIGAVLGLLLLAACAASRPQETVPLSTPTTTPLSWIASIGLLENLANNQHCTATLVQRDVILTASHCLAEGAGTAPLDHFTFLPNEGAVPSFAPLAVTGILQMQEQVQQGVQDEKFYVNDWVLLRIDPAPASLQPIDVVSLRWAKVEERLAAGDRFFSGGYGAVGISHFTQHADCGPVDAARYNVFLEDGLLATNCQVRLQDSGGPMLLVDIAGRPHLIALIGGYATSKAGQRLGVGAVSGSFINYLKPPPVSQAPAVFPPMPTG